MEPSLLLAVHNSVASWLAPDPEPDVATLHDRVASVIAPDAQSAATTKRGFNVVVLDVLMLRQLRSAINPRVPLDADMITEEVGSARPLAWLARAPRLHSHSRTHAHTSRSRTRTYLCVP